MNNLSNYIIEKLKIDRNTKTDYINEKDFELKFEGVSLEVFMRWYTGEGDIKHLSDSNFEEFIDNSNVLEKYFGKNIDWCSDIPKKDFMRLKYTFIQHADEKITLYQKKSDPSAVDCTFEVSFIDKPITFYAMSIYDGPCDKKYDLTDPF